MITNSNGEYIINGFQAGIGVSPISGFYDIRNMNVSTAPGIAKINFELARKTIATATAPTFTADPSTDILTLSSNIESGGLLTNQPFTVSTTGTLPSPLATNTIYYAIRQSSTTIKVATTLANANAGTAIDITDAGTGVHTFNLIRPGRITHFTRKPSSYIFALDENGRLWFDDLNGGTQWYLLAGNTLTNTNGDGLVYWKNYVFVFRNSAIDVLAVSGLSTYVITWSNSWQSINPNNRNHSAIVGQDDIIYFLNGEGTSLGKYFVGSIKEATAPFAPGTGGSYTFNGAALDLPKQGTSLCELGTNLLVGTVGREIYPWDRKSPSFTLPIIVNETNTYYMVNRNNIVYCFTGNSGTIYQTNGSTASIATRFPEMLTGYYYSAQANLVYFYQAIPLAQKILFTLKTSTEGYVCSIDPENGNALTVENTYSIGTTNITDTGALFPVSDKQYLASWETSTDASIDNNSSFFVCDNYEAYITTEFFSPGTYLENATLNQLDISFVTPLTVGQAIRISYRKALSESFTVLKDFTYTDYVALQNIVEVDAIEGIIDLQIKIELDAASSSQVTPQLDYVGLIFN